MVVTHCRFFRGPVIRARWGASPGAVNLSASPLAGVITASVAAVAPVGLLRLGPDRLPKALVALLGLAALGAIVVRPVLGFVLTLAAMPFNLGVSFLGIETDTNTLLLSAATAVLAPRLVGGTSVPKFAVFGSAAIVLGLGIAASGAINTAVAWSGAWSWLIALVPFLAALTLIPQGTSSVYNFGRVLALAGAVSAVIGIGQRYGIYVLFGPPYLSNRIDSSFGYYTQFGSFMAIAAVLAIACTQYALSKRDYRNAALMFGATLLTGYGLAISLSRGALLLFSVAFLTTCLLTARNLRTALSLVASMIVLGSVALAVLPTTVVADFQNRFAGPFGVTSSDQVRVAAQRRGWDLLTDLPMGIGFGNFPNWTDVGHYVPGGRLIRLAHSQSLIVQVGLDAGILGLFGFLALLMFPMLAAFRRSIRGDLNILTAAIAGCLVGFVAQGWGEYLFYEIAFIAIFLSLVWALIASSRMQCQPEAE
jgi:O-antigen ligase